MSAKTDPSLFFCGLVYVFKFIQIFLISPEAMVELDGDEVRISSRGKFAERDIVQVISAVFTFIYLNLL